MPLDKVHIRSRHDYYIQSKITGYKQHILNSAPPDQLSIVKYQFTHRIKSAHYSLYIIHYLFIYNSHLLMMRVKRC